MNTATGEKDRSRPAAGILQDLVRGGTQNENEPQ
jgi:hypothetical protein